MNEEMDDGSAVPTPDDHGEWPDPVGAPVEPPPRSPVGVSPRRMDRRWIVGGAAVIVAGLVGLGAVAASSGSSTVTTGAAAPSTVSESTVPRPERTTVPLRSAGAPTSDRTSVSSTTERAGTATAAPTTTDVPATAPPLDDEPSVVARPVPVDPPPPPPAAPPAPWADSVFTTSGGHVSTDVGCARDLSAAALDEFFAARVGPVLGWDYQHVYPLGGNRHLWLFQDTFIDHSNTAATLGAASFVHNSALIQEGNCFRLLHRGSTTRPTPFELGSGTTTLNTWFWPMGGEVHGGRLYVFWAEMRKDPDPRPPDGLGWHPVATHIAAYDPNTLARLDFRRATSGGASPIYGYAVESDDTYTYLFGNTFEQNLSREGGWSNGPHSGTKMFLARVPKGRLLDAPEYWTRTGWTTDRRNAHAFLQRHWSEFPMQPRYMDGQWIASTAVNGYWGDAFELDVANNPWGPWTTIASGPLVPRGADWKMNTYHAHLMPWRDGYGQAVVSVSNNARNMLRDAWPNPSRYRPNVLAFPWQPPPPETTLPPPTTTTTSSTTTTTLPPTTTTSTTTSTTSTTTSTTSTTTSTTSSTTSTTSTTVPPPPSTTDPIGGGGADESSPPPVP